MVHVSMIEVGDKLSLRSEKNCLWVLISALNDDTILSKREGGDLMSESIYPVYLTDVEAKRLERGWTRAQAAQVLNVHEQHLYRIEKQKSGASLDLALRCARVYGPIKALSDWGEFVIVPGSLKLPDDNEDGKLVGLAGSRRKVRRPTNLGIPVKCMTVLREIGQLDRKLREIHDCMLEVEMGKPGAEERLVTLVKEAQEAFYWIAVLLLHISERYPEVLNEGTEMAFEELLEQVGDEGVRVVA